MDLGLRGKVCVVTGSTAGIGREAARMLAEEGATVVVCGRSQGSVEDARADVGAALGVAADLSEPAAPAVVIEAAETAFGRVDCLVNNVGYAKQASLEELVDDDWDSMWQLNVMSYLRAIRAVVPGMRARGYGRIVNVASIAGKEGNPMAGAYSASKAAVIALTKAIGKDLARTGVLVNCVAPAVIETPILEGITEEHIGYMVDRIPMGRMGEPEEVAALICWLASEECSFSTGATYDISGGRAVY
jgi:2-dehydro-3-deoxy-L-rhamnonate dehydrogenase (NAD+)